MSWISTFTNIVTYPPSSLLVHSFYYLQGNTSPLLACFFVGNNIFGTPSRITMLPKKSTQDAADQRIIPVPRTLVPTLIHKLVAVHVTKS